MQTQSESLPVTPQLGHYGIDTGHSVVRFRTRHLFGLGPVRGTFGIASGSADIAEPLTGSAVQAEIDPESFSTGNAQRDHTVRSPRLLDPRRFPVIAFRHGHVSADGATLTGELTVRDVTRPVTLSLGQATRSADGFTVTATARIDRTEFGVTAMRGLAGRYLDLALEARFIRI
jgi:polyisoprenoid-binding protein YceI